MKFRTTIEQSGKTTTGIRVPEEVVESLGSSKRPAVRVTINGFTYRSTVTVMGGVYMVSLSAENRAGAGVAGGDEVDIDMELYTAPREVSVPEDLPALPARAVRGPHGLRRGRPGRGHDRRRADRGWADRSLGPAPLLAPDHALILAGVLNVIMLALIGWTASFGIAVALLAAWAMIFAIEEPMRQAFINGVIPSQQRATVLSFDALMGSAGGVVAQPALGRIADVFSYGTSYVAAAGIQALAVPFVLLARRENASSDPIIVVAGDVVEPTAARP